MGCSVCPEMDLDDWGDRLLAPLGGRRYPFGGTLELTDRCNLSCVHCYISQPAANRQVQAREMNTAQAIEILDQIAEAGCLFLLLTGGEVFLRPDFPIIYEHARRRGMLVSLFTNGTLITPRLADFLAELRPRSIEITLYGATQETYEKVTQRPGSYARCQRGIDLLLERKLPLALKAVLMTPNRHELPQMRALAEQLGVPFRYDGTLWPRLDGGKQPLDYQISLEEMLQLDLEDPERQLEWFDMAREFAGQTVRNDYVYSCGAGIQTFHIDSAGRLSICTMARNPSYDILKIGFEQGWKQFDAIRSQTRQLDTPCRTCTVGALCGQCPGWSQAIHRDDETPVEFICQLGHLRSAQAQSLKL